jgi:hypothetical protein
VALATSLPRESLVRCSRIQASRSATISRFSASGHEWLRRRPVAVMPITDFVDTSRPHHDTNHIRLGEMKRCWKAVLGGWKRLLQPPVISNVSRGVAQRDQRFAARHDDRIEEPLIPRHEPTSLRNPPRHGYGSSFGELPVGIICTFLTASALLIDCMALAIASDLPTVLPDLEMLLPNDTVQHHMPR